MVSTSLLWHSTYAHHCLIEHARIDAKTIIVPWSGVKSKFWLCQQASNFQLPLYSKLDESSEVYV